MANKQYTIYTTADGVIQRQIACGEGSLAANTYSGEASIEGHYTSPEYKIVSGEAVRQTNAFDAKDFLRVERDSKLLNSDWTQGADSPLTDEKKAEWATYRQALRDMTATFAKALSQEDIWFPEEPS
jgi:hypothetical protein